MRLNGISSPFSFSSFLKRAWAGSMIPLSAANTVQTMPVAAAPPTDMVRDRPRPAGGRDAAQWSGSSEDYVAQALLASLSNLGERINFRQPQDRARLAEGLRKAVLPAANCSERKMTAKSFADLAEIAEIPGLHTNRC
jgi:hypothetical protein